MMLGVKLLPEILKSVDSSACMALLEKAIDFSALILMSRFTDGVMDSVMSPRD
jgi:hypothetical protein